MNFLEHKKLEKNNRYSLPKGVGFLYFNKIKTLIGVNSKFFRELEDEDMPIINKTQNDKYQIFSKQIVLKKAILIKKKYYKGFRYVAGLPAHGQRTHTNAQTTRKIKK